MDADKNSPVSIPRSLKDYRLSVGVGLFYLSIGKRPLNIPVDKTTTARIKLDENALDRLNGLLPHFKSKREVIICALAWIAEQQEHVQQLKI
ncbi:MAG: hypothetical protein JKY93_00400 [Gammaproteobacteria bacterium]|nr:hypothetical protein [Gammaproteobacteria bacterium]